MSNDHERDHESLLAVAAGWERLYGVLFVKAQRLADENARLREEAAGWHESFKGAVFNCETLLGQRDKAEAVCARLRALVSWIDGMCVDEADHMEIRAAINRYHESVAGEAET